MHIPTIIIILIVVWFIILYRQVKQRLTREELLKKHYFQMLLLCTRNEEGFYKLLLRKYLVDSRLYDPKPVKEFNDLWIAISDDAESWTVGSNYIKDKEGIVAPDITEAIAEKIFKIGDNKDFIECAKLLISWNERINIKDLKKAVNYKEHDSFGNQLSEV